MKVALHLSCSCPICEQPLAVVVQAGATVIVFHPKSACRASEKQFKGSLEIEVQELIPEQERRSRP